MIYKTLLIAFFSVLDYSVVVAAPNGTCEVRNFTSIEELDLCKEWSDTSLPLFISRNSNLDRITLQAKIVISFIDSFASPRCIPVFKQLLCLYAFPPCNATTGQPHPICESSCSDVFYGPECINDTENGRRSYNEGTYITAQFLGGPFPNCSKLPYSRDSKEACTSGYIDTSLPQERRSPSVSSSTETSKWLLVGVPVAGTVALFMAVIFIVCCVLHVRRKKSVSSFRHQAREHSNDSRPRDHILGNTATTSSPTENRTSDTHLDESTNRLLKNKRPSDRYLILPKNTEDIVAALDAHEREHFDTVHEQLEDIAETLEHLLVDLNQVVLQEVLGEGAFGLVQKGTLSRNGQLATVAAKSLKDSSSMTQVLEFVRESSMMAAFDHPHILPVSGVCLDMSGGRSPLILVPFMANGDLKTFLKKLRLQSEEGQNDEMNIAANRLSDMCIQIANGMEYLSDVPIVHRDLAARNCMLDDRMVVKIADFGLSRDIYSNNYYRMGSKGKVPVKWMAPESLIDSVYTVQTDVWSYGVTVWEVYSLGMVPYPGLPNYEVLDYLRNGHRLSKPELCPEEVFGIAMKCWEWRSSNRPSFTALKEELSHMVAAAAGYLELETE